MSLNIDSRSWPYLFFVLSFEADFSNKRNAQIPFYILNSSALFLSSVFLFEFYQNSHRLQSQNRARKSNAYYL